MELKESVKMCFKEVLQKKSKSFFWLFFKFPKNSKSWLDFGWILIFIEISKCASLGIKIPYLYILSTNFGVFRKLHFFRDVPPIIFVFYSSKATKKFRVLPHFRLSRGAPWQFVFFQILTFRIAHTIRFPYN